MHFPAFLATQNNPVTNLLEHLNYQLWVSRSMLIEKSTNSQNAHTILRW